MFRKLNAYFSLIKVSHTIFSLPFAIIGALIAITKFEAAFSIVDIFLIIGCLFFARSAAMCFNRLADAKIDAQNPRTQSREIPSGKLSRVSVWLFTSVSIGLFCLSAYGLNPLCLLLSPLVLFIILGYSYTKRITALCHFVLGLGLGMTPAAAFISLSPTFNMETILMGIAILFWVSGFDILYALQDLEFDRANNLFSLPAKMGYKNSHFVSFLSHLITVFIFLFLLFREGYGLYYVFGLLIFWGLIVYQHFIFYRFGLKKMNLAFFTTNGSGSLLFGLFWSLELILNT